MTQPSREELLARLDEGANYIGYPEGFGRSWTALCAQAAQAIRSLQDWQRAKLEEDDARRSSSAQALPSVELDRAKSNHKSVVESKRRTELRLRAMLAALQQIYTVCNDNAGESCDQRMTVNFVREVACDAFEKATTRLVADGDLAALPASSGEVRELNNAIDELIENACHMYIAEPYEKGEWADHVAKSRKKILALKSSPSVAVQPVGETK